MFATWSVSERRGIAAVFATACLAFLAWAFPNMTRLLTVPGAMATGALAIYLLWPEIKAVAGSLTAGWEPDGRVTNGRLRGLIGLVLLCALAGGGYLASHEWPAETGAQAPPTTPPEQAPQGPLTSKYGRIIFICNMPKRPNEIDEWQQYASVVGESQGLTVDMHGLGSDGLRIELTPPPQPIPDYVKSVTEIRRLKDQLYVTRITEFAPINRWMGELTIADPTVPAITAVTSRVEHLIGAPAGTCHLI